MNGMRVPGALALGVVASFGFAAAAEAAGPGGAATTSRVMVGFQPGAQAAASARAAIARQGGRVVVDLGEIDAVAIEIPAKAVAALQRSPGVAYVEDDPVRRALGTVAPAAFPNWPNQTVPYGITMVQADQVSDQHTGNRVLCIVDSGYDWNHFDLALNWVNGQNLTRSGDWNTDEYSHGTHVAGTIAAIDNTFGGVVGVMPHQFIHLEVQKVFDASGSARTSVINRAALNCMRRNANVINLSLGSDVPSRAEQKVYDRIAAAGILSVAAAGNDGNTAISYPAGYESVMSVAAIDEHEAHASFSQANETVEIAGPGVAVYSTVPVGTGRVVNLDIDGTGYSAYAMEGSPPGNVSGLLADFGLGDAVDATVSGQVCLIARGEISFAEKVLNCQASGGIGAVIYNNVDGALFGTLGETVTTIPSVGVSGEIGALLNPDKIGTTASLSVAQTDHGYSDGTSMATPHVSAVAALIWSHHPGCTAQDVRVALTQSAKDLGVAGRDPQTGFGLVQAKAALDALAGMDCAQ